jgi:VanZ family protein
LVVIEIMGCAYDDRMRAVGRFGPPVALMGVIFFLSAQPDLNSGLGTWDTVLRKLAHMAEFGLLWFLWLRALGYRPPAAVVAAAIAAGFAATDELHQLFVRGRVASPLDWAIDCAGVGLAWLAWARFRASRARGTADRPSGSA